MSQVGDEVNDNEIPPSLRADSWVDKAVRFACGALVALLIVGTSVLLLEGPSLAAVAVMTIAAVAVCGTLAVLRGERFIEGMLRTLNRL